MKIKFFFFGKNKFEELRSIENHYQKLISKFADVEIVPLKNSKSKLRELAQKEDELLILNETKKLKSKTIIFDERGENLNTNEFSKLFEENLNFIVGPSYGLSKPLLDSNLKVSFGKLTIAHDLVRIISLESVFRALALKNNHPYHIED